MSDKARKEKEKGNAAFRAGDYPTAIGCYTAAIIADQKDPTYPLNRAAAYLKLGKYEDVERDCNTVLRSSPKNAKGFFRRGQAEVGLGKFIDAQRDFTEALRLEPDSGATKEELRRVVELIDIEKRKKSQPRHLDAAFDSSSHPTSTPKRRRVPITIVEPPSSPAKKLSAEAEQSGSGSGALAGRQPNSPSPLGSGGIAAASQPLRTSPSPSVPENTPELASTPVIRSSPAATPQAAGPKPSFKEAKQARENTRTSLVGGGIFRASGKNTIFPTRGPSTSDSPASAAALEESPALTGAKAEGDVSIESASNPTGISPVTAMPTSELPSAPPIASPASSSASAVRGEAIGSPGRNNTPTEVPATLFDFTQAWRSALTSLERWKLMQMITPSSIPAFCKASLEPTLLVSILETFLVILSHSSSNDAVKIRQYMDSLAKVPRFSTIVLFLSSQEKSIAKEVWRKLGVSTAPGAWGVIGNLSS